MVSFVGLNPSAPVLYLSILVIAVCGIIYELIISSVSSYLWGDSVLYFSITIGLYMSAMGLGAFCSKFFKQHVLDVFICSEILIACAGGVSALFLFWVYTAGDLYEYAMVAITVIIGALVGLEIPLLIRLMEQQDSLRKNVAHVLTYDYIGGLIGALIFPLLLLPTLGLLKTALALGLSNLLIVGLNLVRHWPLLHWKRTSLVSTLLVLGGLGYLFVTSQEQQTLLEQRLYHDQVIFSRQTPYQQITLTQWHQDIRLFLNGGLQFSSLDEYRYHEALVHVPLAWTRNPKNVLVLGGGDGLAVRELLKYPQIEKITLVDLDPEITRMFKSQPLLRQLNQNSLNHPKVAVINQDAYKFIEQAQTFYDVILVDLPDPGHTALAKLYSLEFYHLLKKRLAYQGLLVTQSTSPFFAREAFWCIHQTLKKAGFTVKPYQLDVPSFGNWGFQLASHYPLKHPPHLLSDPSLKFLNQKTFSALFVFPADLTLPAQQQVSENSLLRPVLIRYYDKGWNGIR